MNQELIQKYFEIKKKNNSEFFTASGGNGNQEEWKKKHQDLEVPLLEQMNYEEICYVIKQASSLGERMYLTEKFKKPLVSKE